MAFDSLRGVAALAVAVSHFAQQQIPFCNQGIIGRWLPELGAWGVSVFFVLSGFCIHGAYLRDQKLKPSIRYNWIEYLRRRFFRIYPGMFVALVLSAIVGFFWTTGLIHRPNLRGFFGHMFLLSSFDVANRDGINGVLWSAIVECHFYLMYPILVFCFARFGRWKVLMTVVSISWGYFFLVTLMTRTGNERLMLQMTFPALWWKWCLGVGLAEVYFDEIKFRMWPVFSHPVFVGLVLAVSFSPCLISDVHLTPNFLRFALPFVIAAMVLGISGGRIRFLKLPLLKWIGRISYSIYLYHPLVLVAFNVLNFGAWWWNFFLFLLLTIVAGTAGYYLVEVPGIALKKGTWPSGSALAGAKMN